MSEENIRENLIKRLFGRMAVLRCVCNGVSSMRPALYPIQRPNQRLLKMLKTIFIAAALSASLGTEVAWAQFDIYVTPNANSQATLADLQKNGKTPVTLIRALAILKDPSLRDAKGMLRESITIHLASGTYYLDETLNIDSASSGNPEHPVIIEGTQDANAIISGGRAVHGFSRVTDPLILAQLPETARSHVLQADLPKQGITDYGTQARHGYGSFNKPAAMAVFYRNQPMILARWPKQGFAKIDTAPDGEKGLTFTMQGANLASWKDEPALLATGYWFYDWADATIPVKSVDVANNRITLTAPNPPFGIKPGQRVFIQNALAELDQPGEWYLDTQHGRLYFWPPESPKENAVEVSMLEKLLVMDNASNIQISGVTFQSARGDAITVRGGQNVSIANSIIRNIGNRGAVLSGQKNGLTNMLIENIGESGVVLSGGDRQKLAAANLYVKDSTIRRFARVSRTYQPGVIVGGVGNRVIGNTIYDGPHAAILFGGNDHLISENEIYDACKETGDAGAIYTGRDWTARGTVISSKYIHHIPPHAAHAIYLDDQASGIIVRGNQFDRVGIAVFVGGGRDNLVEDNIFINTLISMHLDARGKTWQKPMVDDVNGQLQRALRAVPYDQEPYRDRYAHLANILTDDLGAPKYNVFRRNQVIGNARLDISKDSEAGISVDQR